VAPPAVAPALGGVMDRWPASSSLVAILGLFLLPLILFAPVTIGPRTLLPVDNLFTFEPYRAAADELGVGTPHNALLSDLILENYAWKRFIVQSIRARQLPLWNPYLFAGSPFLATGQHSALYPLSTIFYVLPLWRAYGIFTVIQLGLAGAFMFLFARILGISRLGATVAGITFELSGFSLVSVVHPMIIAAAAWLPLVLTAIELIVQQRPLWGRPATVPWVLMGALALGCSALAGHAEVLYFSLLVSAFFTIWRLIYQFFNSHDHGWSEQSHLGMSKLARPAVWILVMVLLGLGLGAIQLLPYAELVSVSFREGRSSLSEVRGWAYPARRLVTFLVPNFYGNPADHAFLDVFSGRVIQSSKPIDWGIKNYVEGGAYLGILPLFLAVLAVLNGFSNTRLPHIVDSRIRRLGTRILGFFRHPYIPLFLVLALLSLAFVFGTPLYGLVYALPYISQSHSPFRWVFPLTLSVAIMAGFGVNVLQRSRRDLDTTEKEGSVASRITDHASRNLVSQLLLLEPAPSLISALAAVGFWSGLLLIGGLLVSRLFFAQLESVVTRVFHSLALADTVFLDARAFYSYEFRWLLLSGLLLMGTGIVLRLSRRPIYLPRRLKRRPVWEALAIGLLALDLLGFGWGFHTAADPTLLDYVPPVVEFLKQDAGPWRFTTFDPDDHKTFNANAGWFYDLQDIRGYDSLFTAQYRDYMRLIDDQDELLFNRIAPLRHWSGLDSPMLDMLNVKYVLAEEEERLDKSPKYRLVYEDRAVRVYENLGALPRAYLMDFACTIASENPLDTMQQVDPRQTVIVSATDLPALPTAAEGASCAPDPAQSINYNMPNEVLVDVETQGRSWLVLADSYFPGWKAFVRPQGGTEVEETELEITRVAANFRGVVLDAGSWTVRFKYSPNTVKIGAFATFLSGVICLFLAGSWLWRFFYRETDSTSTARRVAKNSLAPIALNLMNRIVDMGFAALMARILGPEGSGKYAYAIFIFGSFDILTNFGLNALLLREVARDKGQANRYFVNTTVLRLILIGLTVPMLGIFLLGRQTLGETELARDTIDAILLLFVGLVPATISTGLTALFQAYEKHEIPAAITSVATLIKVSLGTLVLMLGWSIVGLAGVSIVTNTVTLIILMTLAARLFFRPRLENDWPLQRSMAVESFPLMLNHLMATLFFRVDIFLIEGLKNRRRIDGNVLVGWYSWAYKGIDALNIIPAFFTFAIFPVMSRQAHEDREALSNTYHLAIKLLVVLALPAAMGMTLLARPFIAILGGNAFLPDSAIALQLMVWSIPIGWINSVTNYVLIALDQQRFLTRAFVAGLTFNLVANWIFIPLYDYRAAAIITIFSELVLLTAFYVGIRRYLAPVPWWALLWRPGMAGAAMVGVGLTLWPANGLLALLASLGIYALSLILLGAFTSDEIALVLGRRKEPSNPKLDIA
jgi:O-antigen/teichoic acid export membrane protein